MQKCESYNNKLAFLFVVNAINKQEIRGQTEQGNVCR